MSTPKCVTDTIAALRSERVPVAARLDAIDLAIENLSRAWGIGGEVQTEIAFERRVKRPYKKRASKEPQQVDVRLVDGTDAAQRRDVLLGVIAKSEVGLTAAELRKMTPKMAEKDRTNALQLLRMKGAIRRAGNAWVKAA